MKDILDTIKMLVQHGAVGAINAICRTLGRITGFFEKWIERKDRREKQKDIDKAEKKVEDACQNGQLSDLIDAAEKLGDAKTKHKTVCVAAVICVLTCGCHTVNVDVNSARQWEGRYSSKAEAEAALSKVDFKKDKSVWLLTPDTLSRIITSAQEK